MHGRTGFGRNNRTFRVTKNRKMWRLVIAYVLIGHGT